MQRDYKRPKKDAKTFNMVFKRMKKFFENYNASKSNILKRKKMSLAYIKYEFERRKVCQE